MRRSIHHISVKSSLLQHEIDGLKKTLKTQKKHKKKNKALDLQQRQESTVVLFSGHPARSTKLASVKG
jgi:hypothetical protein